MHVLNVINSIANIEGRGREDLDISILLNAEKILDNFHHLPDYKPVLSLAKEVRSVF